MQKHCRTHILYLRIKERTTFRKSFFAFFGFMCFLLAVSSAGHISVTTRAALLIFQNQQSGHTFSSICQAFFRIFLQKNTPYPFLDTRYSSCHLNLMTLGFSGVHLFCTTLLVPVAGVEPARHRWRRILSPLRLPIPSYRQICLPCRVGTDGSGRNGIVSRSMGVRTDWWYYSTFRAE